MKFIAIDKVAAKSLVSMRNLQSTEYDAGLSLTSIITGKVDSDVFLDDVEVLKLKDGVAFLGAEPRYSHILVIDTEAFDGFFSCSAADALNRFQKVCRTALKYWDKIPFGSREWLKQEKDLIVLIPKKNSISDGAKILVDIKPDSARQDKRDTNHLLVFHCGTEIVSQKPSVTNFRKALEQVKSAEINRSKSKSEGVVPLRVEKLDDDFRPIDSNTSFETWRRLLTSSQSKFVFRDDYGPERIEGAAGTGKTLSLSLRCCNVLENAKNENKSLRVAFLTHSHASKEYIENIIFPKLPWYYKQDGKNVIELTTVTLQGWCIASLGNKIEESELLDKDAQSSKEYQQILISDVLNDFIDNNISSYKKFISQELYEFFLSQDENLKIQSIQHEIAEIIKGRSGQDLSKYKKTINNEHSVPLIDENDYECVFGLYSLYQDKLESTGYFDSDDIILSALGQLDSPIWRRRRNTEGFDILFVDETHLFNLNELSVMHHILKDKCASNIIYSVDRSQSLANVSLDSQDLDRVFGNESNHEVSLQTVFRSSPDIVRFAFSVLSSGSTIFTNMENPLDKIEGSFTEDEEKRSKKPYCLVYESDEEVIINSFKCADRLANETSSKRCNIIIVAATYSILNGLERYAIDNNKPAQFIKRRGDKKAQSEAEKGNKYIVSGIDYVGGLEFDGAVIVGVDKGHMPATEENEIDSKHFLNHASYNRMYVAITRAKYGISILCNSARGVSKILEFPISEKVVDVLEG